MLKIKPFLSILLIAITTLLLLPACTGATVDTTIPITLVNSSKVPVKMWLGHDKTPPANASLVEKGGLAVWTASVKTVLNDDKSVKEYSDSVRVNAADKDGKLLSQQMVSIRGVSGAINIYWDGNSFSLK